jgi:hypothetical protein
MHPVVRSSKTLDVRCRLGGLESSFPHLGRFNARPPQVGTVPLLKMGRG